MKLHGMNGVSVPILGQAKMDPQLALFAAMAAASQGHSRENVAGAAANMVVNVVHESATGSKKAGEERLEQVVTWMRRALADRYKGKTSLVLADRPLAANDP